MKRREFIRLTAAGSALVMLPGCGREPAEPMPAGDAGLAGVPRRSELLPFDDIVSMHEHVDSREGAELLLRAMDATGIRRMNLLGCYPSMMHGARDPDFSGANDNNELLAGLVSEHPDRFSMFALMNGLEDDPVAALRGWIERGAIGVKMYNGAHGKYRTMPLDDPRLVPLLESCELHGVPILVHVDPPHLDEFLAVARDYPAVPWICPHLFVMTRPEHIQRLARILRRYPNLHTDGSFGFEGWMHSNLSRLSESRDAVREIFIRHADQILFGTDIVVATNSPHRTVEWAANSISEYRKFLEFDVFDHRVQSRRRLYEGELRGLSLPDDVLRRIYAKNAGRFLGRARPRFRDDDLDRVLVRLPPSARLVPGGGHSLFAVAAAANLSPIEDLDVIPGAVERWVSTAELASGAAAALGLPPDRMEILRDAHAVEAAAASDHSTVAVIPLAGLGARLRALPIGGFDPAIPAISRCADAGTATRSSYFGGYPLLMDAEVGPDDPADARFEPHQLRTVVFTGGSLFGKGMIEADAIEPGQAVRDIAPLAQAADITHLAVENVILDECKQDLEKWRFCYETDWLEAIDLLGADVIDLTGNHLSDFGRKPLERTLAAYREMGLATFGGGRNLADALDPAVIRVRGLRVGFTGINRLNRESVAAGPDRPGPLVGYVDDVLEDALDHARDKSDVFFFTYQGGYEFSPFPWNGMVRQSHRAVDGGAIGAVGVHPHMPSGAEVYRDAIVAYGLGNFLFRHPPSAIPKRPETEIGMVLRVTLLGERLLQAAFIPIRMDNGAVSPAAGADARASLDRARLGSSPGLVPERPLARFADSCIDINATRDIDGPVRVQSKLGMSGMLLGMRDSAVRKAGGVAAALEILQNARERGSQWSAPELKIALPLVAGERPPAGGFDAVRINFDSSGDDRSALMETARAVGRPIQIRIAKGVSLDQVSKLVSGVREVPVILSGLADFARDPAGLTAFMKRHRNVHFDTSAMGPAGFVDLFDGFEDNREVWRGFFRSFSSRMMLATGASRWSRQLRWNMQSRLLRALCRALERDEYRLPLLEHGNLSEWYGYRYVDEPLRRGLGLGPRITDAIAGENFHALFSAG